MTIAYWCVLVMIVFPYFFAMLAKSGPNFNNHDPRLYLQNITGWRKRADYIQKNTFETTPAFGIAVIISHLIHAHQQSIDTLAIAYVISRIFYALCYLSDKASLRSLFWTVGMICIIGLFCIR